MVLTNNYLITIKNVEAFFNAIISAQAPERFTQKFLEALEFKSTNDRLFIGILKALGFIDETGIPTQIYFNFLDQTQSKMILAKQIREAYSDLFAVNINAQNLTVEEVKNKLKTLTQGSKSEKVLTLMANTFKALCEYADWKKVKAETKKEEKKEEGKKVGEKEEPNSMEKIPFTVNDGDNGTKVPSLNYNIQIHLPETRDIAVYDSIFKSLREHLLRNFK